MSLVLLHNIATTSLGQRLRIYSQQPVAESLNPFSRWMLSHCTHLGNLNPWDHFLAQ